MATRQIIDFLSLMKSHIQLVFLNTYSVSAQNADEVIKANDLLKKQSIQLLEQLKSSLSQEYGFEEDRILLISEIGNVLNVVPRIVENLSIDLLVWEGSNHYKFQQISEKVKNQDSSCSIIKVINPKR